MIRDIINAENIDTASKAIIKFGEILKAKKHVTKIITKMVAKFLNFISKAYILAILPILYTQYLRAFALIF